MRIAVLSDVHGNLAALQAVASELSQERSLDAVIVAGDHLWGGPRPAEAWRFLGETGWTLVRGNEDESLASQSPARQPSGFRFSRAYAAHHRWAREQLELRDLAGIGTLPFSVRLPTPAGDLLVVHASPRSTTDRFGGPHNTDEEVETAYAGTGAGAIAFGHWHASFVRPTPFTLLVNVASVGLPLDGRPLAAYSLLTARATGWTVEQRRLPYDHREEERAAVERGLPPWCPDESVVRGSPERGCQAA